MQESYEGGVPSLVREAGDKEGAKPSRPLPPDGAKLGPQAAQPARLAPSSAADDLVALGTSFSFRAFVSSSQGYCGDRVHIPRALRAAPGAQDAPSPSPPPHSGDLAEPGGVGEGLRAAWGFNWAIKDSHQEDWDRPRGRGQQESQKDFVVSKCVFHDKTGSTF